MNEQVYAGIGSRETPNKVLRQMEDIAARLRLKGWTLRSGHAPGADQAFEKGAGAQAEIYLPWSTFEADVKVAEGAAIHTSPRGEAFEIAAEHHPAWPRLKQGARKLHARNTHIVLGWDKWIDKPVKFVVCWTPNGAPTGGTGQALRIAHHECINVYNLFFTSHLLALKEDWL